MSVQSIQRNIRRIQRDIRACQKKLTNETQKEAQKNERICRIHQSLSGVTSLSTIRSKQRKIERLEREVVQIQKKKVDLTKRIADKTAELHKYQQQLSKEQTREQGKLLDSLKRQSEEAQRRQEEVLLQLNRAAAVVENGEPERSEVAYDAFISHASEDKDDLVRPLAERLREAGFSIWYDEFQLKLGDSLRRSIDRGLANSRFGIVVLSPDFFAKNWPQYELDGLVAREMNGGKIILPLWHKVSKDEVMRCSPSLADKVALNTAMYTIDELAEKLVDALA
jgi:hypothetical protein